MILGTELQAIVYGVDSKANWYRKLVESYTTRLNWEPSKKMLRRERRRRERGYAVSRGAFQKGRSP